MSLSAIQAARDYVEDAARRSVLAISPRTISTRLGCNDEQAVAILKTLRNDGYGEFRGYVHCSTCRETRPLTSNALIDMIGEAAALAETTCRYCNNELASDRDNIEVQLSFFLNAVADHEAATASASRAVSSPENSTLPLRLLEAADRLNVQYVVVQGGATVTMQPASDGANAELKKSPDSAVVKADISAHLDVTAEGISKQKLLAKGRETYRHRRSRSKLLAFFLGDSEEERHREGDYNESASTSRNWAVRVGVIVVVVAIVAAAIVLLVKLFG